jgi:uncharacterized protein (DUF2164 family)
VLVELCGVGSTLADLLRTETEDDIEKVEAAAAAAREHTLAYNAPLRAVLQRAEPRVAASKGKGALSLRLDDRMKTGDCYVNQGLSTAVAAAEKIPGVELYHIEAAKCALRLRMAILAEDAAGIRAALHGISAASGGTLVEHKHGLVEAGRTLEARLAAQSAMLTAMNQRNLARLTSAVAEGENQERAAKLLPFLEKQTMAGLTVRNLIQGSGFGVQGSGFGVQGSGSRIQGLGLGVWTLGVRETGSGVGVSRTRRWSRV